MIPSEHLVRGEGGLLLLGRLGEDERRGHELESDCEKVREREKKK